MPTTLPNIALHERRRFLALSLAGGLSCLAPPLSHAALSASKSIRLHREGSGESIIVNMDRENLANAYQQLCWMCRDVRSGAVIAMNPRLLDRLWAIQSILESAIGFNGNLVIQSGYRTHKTNREAGGAIHSWHLRGGALDFHAEGVNMKTLFEFMRGLGYGGVGYYPRRNDSNGWMHMDEGQFRQWVG